MFYRRVLTEWTIFLNSQSQYTPSLETSQVFLTFLCCEIFLEKKTGLLLLTILETFKKYLFTLATHWSQFQALHHEQSLKLKTSGGPLDNQTWYTNHRMQKKFGFHIHTTALWSVEQASILSAKFDCPVAHQDFSLDKYQMNIIGRGFRRKQEHQLWWLSV